MSKREAGPGRRVTKRTAAKRTATKRTTRKRAPAKRAIAKRTIAKRTIAKRTGTKRAAKPARKRGGSSAGRTRSHPKKRTAATRRSRDGAEDRGQTVGLLRELTEHHETGPAATAGDLDADWQRAESSGEEAVGGSVSTPDQDLVDEIGHALGVEPPPQAPLRGSEEILEERDRRYWELERRAGRKADKRHEP